jgi:hypothetical protein
MMPLTAHLHRITIAPALLLTFTIGCASAPPETGPPSDATYRDEPLDISAIEDIAVKVSEVAVGSSVRYITFEGSIVRKSKSGDLLPLANASVFLEDEEGEWIPADVEIDPTGHFERQLQVLECTLYEDGKPTSTLPKPEFVFLFRANGCKDKRIVVKDNWAPQRIKLKCPDLE